MPVKPKATPPKVTLFVQDNSGDHNLETEYPTRDMAWAEIEHIRQNGGYWTNDGDDNIFVPWHRVDFVRVKENNG